MAGGILCSNFFEDKKGRTIIGNLAIINQYFITVLQDFLHFNHNVWLLQHLTRLASAYQ